MASVSVYTCPGANQSVDASGAPICTGGVGQWQQVTLQEPFDPSSLDSGELGAAFGAGFVVVATGCVIAWGARQLIGAIRDSLGF